MEEKREDVFKTKTKNFLKNNLWFVLILVLGILIRLYFFTKTATQPLWWDEADYLAYAKNLANIGNVDWIVTSQHNSLLPYVAALFFKVGLSESSIKFFLILLPSILLIPLVYFLLNLMYSDKKIAIISSLLISVSWPILFNTSRFHLGIPALLFGMLSIYVFWQGYEKKQKIFGILNSNWAIPLTVFLIMVSYSIRRSYLIFGLFFFFYVISTKKFKEIFSDKYNWIGLLVAVTFFLFSENFIFSSSLVEVVPSYYNEAPFSLLPFDVFVSYFQNIFNPSFSPFFYLFYLGFFLICLSTFSNIKDLRENKNNNLKSNLFFAITLIITLSYFLFFQRRIDTFGEPRWYFPLILGSFVCISQATIFIDKQLKKYNKIISVALISLLLIYGAYAQFQHSKLLILDRTNTFLGVKNSGEYILENSNIEDIIISVPVTQTAYYSERRVLEPWRYLNASNNQNTSLEEFLTFLTNDPFPPKYLVVTFSEPNHPSWMLSQNQIRNTDNGQVGLLIEIPFSKTTINFLTGQQDIKQKIDYEKVSFELKGIFEDAFVYEIIKNKL